MTTSLPAELTTYYGNCHCGAVRFIVRTPSLSSYTVGSCNCSICTRNGYLLIFPSPENLDFSMGKEDLAEYFFGNKKFAHRFCKTCGSSVSGAMMTDNGELEAINVRCF